MTNNTRSRLEKQEAQSLFTRIVCDTILYMPLSGVAKIASAVEKIAEPVVENVVQQIRPPMPPEDIRMLYGDFGQVPSDEKLYGQREFHDMRVAQDLRSARQQHAQILGNTTQASTEQQPVLNPFSNRQTDEVSRHQVRTAVQDIRSSAENLGVKRQNAREQQRRKEELEAEEKARKEAEKKVQLETQIETPPGKITGLSFKRKRVPPRMQPPKSAETRASQGVGG